MCSQSQVKEVEEENSKLQLQLKELNEEYRARLACYLQDLAVSLQHSHKCKIKVGQSQTQHLPCAITSICMSLI